MCTANTKLKQPKYCQIDCWARPKIKVLESIQFSAYIESQVCCLHGIRWMCACVCVQLPTNEKTLKTHAFTFCLISNEVSIRRKTVGQNVAKATKQKQRYTWITCKAIAHSAHRCEFMRNVLLLSFDISYRAYRWAFPIQKKYTNLTHSFMYQP